MCGEFNYFYRIAEALICAKKYREASFFYGILLKLKPENASLWHGFANCLEKIGDREGSKIAYENALKYHLIENDRKSLLWGGWAAMKLGNIELAYNLFKKSLKEDPSYAYTWISFAAAASKIGKDDEAEEARKMYRNLVKKNPYKRRECEGKEMLEEILKKCDGIWKEFLELMINEIGCVDYEG